MRILAALCLGLCMHLQVQLAQAAPARAGMVRAAEGAAEPAGPRFIRIGPQALVGVDERGRMTMVDEPPAPDLSGGQVLRGILGVLGAGAVLGVLLYDEGGLLFPERPTFIR